MMLTPDQSKAVEETAKAVQESAKAVQNVVKAASDAGHLVAKAFAPISSDLVGIAHDYIREVRERVLLKQREKTATLLRGISDARLSLPSPTILIPLIEAAQDETRDELQDLWAAHLANAFIDRGRKLRPEYRDIIRQLTPSDVLLLSVLETREQWKTLYPIPDSNLVTNMPPNDRLYYLAATEAVGLSVNEVQIGQILLARINLINSHDPPPTLSPLGVGFVAACRVE